MPRFCAWIIKGAMIIMQQSTIELKFFLKERSERDMILSLVEFKERLDYREVADSASLVFSSFLHDLDKGMDSPLSSTMRSVYTTWIVSNRTMCELCTRRKVLMGSISPTAFRVLATKILRPLP